MDDIYFVTGTVRAAGPIPLEFSRAMTVVRHGGALTLINSMRLDEQGLAALDALGKVENVIRLAGFHGMDDAFYKERYGAEVFAVKGQLYVSGFDAVPKPENRYFEPDVEMTADTPLPLPGAELYIYPSARVPEALLRLDRHGGIVVAGDSLQNWDAPDAYTNFPARIVMRLMGFFKPHNIGPGWLRAAKPDKRDLEAVLDLEFDHLLPVHGKPVIGGAKDAYRPAIARLR